MTRKGGLLGKRNTGLFFINVFIDEVLDGEDTNVVLDGEFE